MSGGVPQAIAARNPYPGLRPFDERDVDVFFGRDGQSDELIRRLDRRRFVGVVGTSGSGKSSLVRAGLVPALRAGFMTPAGYRWTIAILRPGSDPIGNTARALDEQGLFLDTSLEPADRRAILATTLRRSAFGLVDATAPALAAAPRNLLVVVDQFEELFRPRASDGDRDGDRSEDPIHFVRTLLGAVSQQDLPIYVIATMRSDYVGECSRFRGLPEMLNESQYLIPRLTRHELRQVILEPARTCGALVDPDLAERLLNDVGDDPDQLPVLQHALLRSWDEFRRDPRKDAVFGIEHYRSSGAMATALGGHVEDVYGELSARQEAIARRLFQRLTEKGIEGRDTRRIESFQQLREVCAASEAELVEVIEVFRRPGCAFLMPPAGEPLLPDADVDITHESVIRKWSRLQRWVQNEAESAAVYRRMQEDASRRREHWRAANLAEANRWRRDTPWSEPWARRYGGGYPETLTFLNASEAKERRRSRARLAVQLLIASLAVALGLLAWSFREQQHTAEGHARRSLVRQLLASAELVGADDRALSALLLAEALKRDPTFEADLRLRTALRHLPRVAWTLPSGGGLSSLAFSPNGRMLVVVTSTAGMVVLDHATRREIGRIPFQAHRAAFSRDGTLLAAAGYDELRLYDVADWKERWRAGVSGEQVGFTTDGLRVIAGGHLLDAASGSVDWQLATPLKVTSLRFSPDGALAAFFKGFDGVSLVTVPDGKELWHGLKGDLGGALAFTDDGSHLAAADQAGNVVVVQIGERRVLWQSRIDRMFTGLAFSPGRRPDTAGHLAAANITYTRVFDYFRWRGGRMNEPSERLRMPPLTRLTFSPDGWLLGGVRYNDPWNEAVLVDTRGGELFRVHHDYAIDGLAFSPDGAFFATGDRQGRVIVVHAGSPWELWRFQADAPLTSIVFGPGGRVFLADAESARVMDAASRQADWSSPELKGVTAAAFSPDGKELTISHDRQLILVDLARGAIVWRRRMDVDAVAFLPAGILVQRENSDEDTEQVLLSAATGEDLGLAQWHGRLLGADASGRTLFAATAERVLLRSRSQDASLWYQTAKMWGIRQVAFSGDGTVLAVARKRDGRRPGGLQVIDAGKDTTGGMRWERDSGDGFNAVAVDATGARVATGGLDGLVKVFSAADGTELVRIPHVDPVIEGLAFSRDGRAIYTCTRRGCEAHPLESQALVDQACARLPRNLTTAEWNGYLVGSPYRETCPGLPRAR